MALETVFGDGGTVATAEAAGRMCETRERLCRLADEALDGTTGGDVDVSPIAAAKPTNLTQPLGGTVVKSALPRTSNRSTRRRAGTVGRLGLSAVAFLLLAATGVDAQCPTRFMMAPDGGSTAYGIAIKTGTVSGAGTDGDIYIKLEGSNADTDWIQVDPPGNSYENGSWDCDRVSLRGALRPPLKLAVRNSGGGSGPDWYLERVCVSPLYAQQACNQPTTHNFYFNMWLESGTTTFMTPATNPPQVRIFPAERNVQSGAARRGGGGAPDHRNWVHVPGAATDVGVGADGSVWVVNANGHIYHRAGNQWGLIEGELRRIAVGPDGLAWGVNSAGGIYRRVGGAPPGSHWEQLPGAATDIGVGSDGSVWVVNANGQIYFRTGNQWRQIEGELRRIAVGPDGLAWGVNSAGGIYRRVGGGPPGARWEPLPGAASDIGVGADGTAWIVNSSGQIFYWNGTDWSRIEGGLSAISVGPDGLPWGVNSSGEIYRSVR